MNTIKPTRGRIVLFFTQDSNGKGVTLPAIITHVHSDDCVSLVAFSAFSDIESLLPGGTRPVTSVLYDERQLLNTWRWGEFQMGQASRADDIQKFTEETFLKATNLLSEQYDDAIVKLRKQITDLEATVAALNAKQPAAQRLPVADPTPVVGTADKQPEPQELPAGHPDLLGIDGAGGEGLRG